MKNKNQYEALRESFYRGESVQLPETEFFDSDVKELDTHFLYACGVRKIYAEEVLLLHNEGWHGERFDFCHTPKLIKIEGQFICTEINVSSYTMADEVVCEKVTFSSTPTEGALAAFVPLQWTKKFNDFYFEMEEKANIYQTAPWYSSHQDLALWSLFFFDSCCDAWEAIFSGQESFSEELFQDCAKDCVGKMEVQIKAKNAQFEEWFQQLRMDFEVTETEWRKSWKECRFAFATDKKGFDLNEKTFLKWLAKNRGVASLT